MRMPDTDPNLRHWLSVHERVRKHIQRSVALLAVVATIAVVQGFGRLQSLNEGYQFAREFTLQIQEGGPREEAARLFESRCRNASPGCKVRLEEIPEVGWEYGRFLSRNQPSGIFEVGGYKFGYAAFFWLLVFAPLALVVVIYLKLRTTAQIARMLREKAVERSEVQQRLNSVFNERATKRLGDYRWSYATVCVLIMLVLSLTPPIFYLTMHAGVKINTEVVIDKQGNISPLSDVRLDKRTIFLLPSGRIFKLTTVIILTIMCLGLLTWMSVVQQLSPLPKPEARTDKNAS